jgi:hypothetical protein
LERAPLYLLYSWTVISYSVTGQIRDEVIVTFNSPNPSLWHYGRRVDQSLTEISTRTLPVGKARPVLKSDNLTVDCLENVGVCYRGNFIYFHVRAPSSQLHKQRLFVWGRRA